MDNPRSAVRDPQWYRPAVQVGFVLSSLLVGYQFHRFVVSLSDPLTGPAPVRPASVEAWLPISSLMSLTYLAKTGLADRVRPAGLVLFSLTLLLTLAVRRGFCSWVCPIGTLSEYAHKAGRTVLGRNLSMPRWLDVILRSLKYLLLGFFLYAILWMPARALAEFIHGPYNRVADVKMYLLFRNISWTSLWVLATLAGLSMLFKNFWCRYLCPYGALLGLLSMVSPTSIRRNSDRCVECGQCGKACPNRIPVHTKRRVRSVECIACFSCVDACPKSGALRMAMARVRAPVTALAYGTILVAAFILVPQIARAAGHWETDTPPWLYRRLHARIRQISHPGTAMMYSTGPPASSKSGAVRTGRDDRDPERPTAAPPPSPRRAR